VSEFVLTFSFTGNRDRGLPRPTKETLKHVRRGSTVYAAEDIHSCGNLIVKAGDSGKVDSRGEYALNVKFEGYVHIILCSWDMVLSKPPSVIVEPPSQLRLFE